MQISEEIAGVSAYFSLDREGTQVFATLMYSLTGDYDPIIGENIYTGEMSARIGGDSATIPDSIFFDLLYLELTATLVPGVAEASSYSMKDLDGPDFKYSFNVVLFSDAANFGGTVKADYVFGSSFADNISGGRGDDIIEAGSGKDTLAGGNGNDTLDGGSRDDRLNGGNANDWLSGDLGNDRLSGGFGADTLSGYDGDDALYGGGAKDSLGGGEGADTVFGGDGDDTIDGWAGGDRLAGGNGRDQFYYEVLADSRGTGAGRDVIEDFNTAEDLIDLHDIDAKPGAASNEAFAFIGTDAFTAAGQVRFQRVGDNCLVLVNANGAGGAEMTIKLSGVDAVTEANFIL
ncbi:hypothetical protein BH10PSE7_BH10PSE7_42810 [soil metagenome]